MMFLANGVRCAYAIIDTFQSLLKCRYRESVRVVLSSNDKMILACSSCPIFSECGKREAAHIKWSMVKPKKVTPVTGTTLRTIVPVPADSRQ